jgi:flavin reductase (DIM6/NTAB) family NADH-FMN oxidoreductase RutF
MKEIERSQLPLDPFSLIGGDWFLLTAGTEESGYNTMTCSWGHFGPLWASDTAVVYVRPQRYTKEFVDREELYTLSFFDGRKKELGYLGSRSGRDEDKVAAVGLTPVFEEGYTYFKEAKLVVVCKKLYQAPLKEEYFLDKETMEKNYPDRDFHDLYVGKIEKILVAE